MLGKTISKVKSINTRMSIIKMKEEESFIINIKHYNKSTPDYKIYSETLPAKLVCKRGVMQTEIKLSKSAMWGLAKVLNNVGFRYGENE